MNYPDRRMDSDMNHTVRDVVIVHLLPVVNKGFVLFAPGVVVGVHVTYWVKEYILPPLKAGFDWRCSSLPTSHTIPHYFLGRGAPSFLRWCLLSSPLNYRVRWRWGGGQRFTLLLVLSAVGSFRTPCGSQWWQYCSCYRPCMHTPQSRKKRF